MHDSDALAELEPHLLLLITQLNNDIKTMRPAAGFSSPRDIPLVTLLNKKSAILDHLQKAMRVINQDFDINA